MQPWSKIIQLDRTELNNNKISIIKQITLMKSNQIIKSPIYNNLPTGGFDTGLYSASPHIQFHSLTWSPGLPLTHENPQSWVSLQTTALTDSISLHYTTADMRNPPPAVCLKKRMPNRDSHRTDWAGFLMENDLNGGEIFFKGVSSGPFLESVQYVI